MIKDTLSLPLPFIGICLGLLELFHIHLNFQIQKNNDLNSPSKNFVPLDPIIFFYKKSTPI